LNGGFSIIFPKSNLQEVLEMDEEILKDLKFHAIEKIEKLDAIDFEKDEQVGMKRLLFNHR
jgi:ATP-dependent Lon protease